jgi:hypothetical protein
VRTFDALPMDDESGSWGRQDAPAPGANAEAEGKDEDDCARDDSHDLDRRKA